MTNNNGVRTVCWKCGVEYTLPPALYHAAKARSNISFFCPYGHEAHYPDGETEEQKLRRERDRLQQQMARVADEAHQNLELARFHERSAAAYKGQVTKLKKRAKAGVCPCCSRHFANLERHMASKHPDMDPEAPLTVIEGGRHG